MDKKNELLCKIALHLYDEENKASDIYDTCTREDLKRLSSEVLSDISSMVYSKLVYFQDAENLFTLVLEYGEFRSKEFFSAGFEAGIRVSKELDRV